MDYNKSITTEKCLRYAFLVLFLGATLFALLNLSTYLKVGEKGAMIRGWVSYATDSFSPETLPTENGQVRIFNMKQHRLAMVEFDHFSNLFQGLPWLYLLIDTTSNFLIAWVLYQMMLIFRSLDRGEVFRENNLPRLRNIAYSVLVYSVLTFINGGLFAHYIQHSGEQFLPAYSTVYIERILMGGLLALIIFALLKAFKLGIELQQEQDLTI